MLRETVTGRNRTGASPTKLFCRFLALQTCHVSSKPLRAVERLHGSQCHCLVLWRPAWATRPEIPEKIKWPKSSSKVGLGGNSQSRSKSRSGSRFSSLPLHENLLPDLLFDLLWEFPPKPTFELLFGHFIFSGISGLVAHAGRHKFSIILKPRRRRHVNNFWPHFQTIFLSSGEFFVSFGSSKGT